MKPPTRNFIGNRRNGLNMSRDRPITKFAAISSVGPTGSINLQMPRKRRIETGTHLMPNP